MKPKDLLIDRLQLYVVPTLEKYGFAFSKSSLSFKKRIEKIDQKIVFSLSKWNEEDHCTFWSSFGTQSSYYVLWHKKKWGMKPVNNALTGCADWDVEGWSDSIPEKLLIQNTISDQEVMSLWLRTFESAGRGYLDRIADWEGAADQLLSERRFWTKASNFFLIADQEEKAWKALESGIYDIQENGRADNYQELPVMRERLKNELGQQGS